MSSHQASPFAQPTSWTRVSSGYDKYTRDFLAQYSRAGLERLDLSSSHRLLDVACGPGTASVIAADQVRTVDALDFSAGMLDQFRSRLEREPMPNITIHEGDGQALPFEDDGFDRAVSMFGLMFFPDRVRGMTELFRTLAPGGRVLISSWAPMEDSSFMMALVEAGQAADPSQSPPTKDLDSLENVDVFTGELIEAGFTDIEIVPHVGTYVVESGGQLWDEMTEGAIPLTLLADSLDPTDWDAYAATARSHLDQAVAPGDELTSTAFLAYGTKPLG